MSRLGSNGIGDGGAVGCGPGQKETNQRESSKIDELTLDGQITIDVVFIEH